MSKPSLTMKHNKHLSESLMNFRDYYEGDMDDLPAIFVLSSYDVDDYYFDKKAFSKTKMKEVAEEYRATIEKKSNFPVYCFGASGKYLISPSVHILPIDSLYDYQNFKYTKTESFSGEYFKIPGKFGTEYYSPKAFIRKICTGIGADELIPILTKHINPVQEYFDKNIADWNKKKYKIILS